MNECDRIKIQKKEGKYKILEYDTYTDGDCNSENKITVSIIPEGGIEGKIEFYKKTSNNQYENITPTDKNYVNREHMISSSDDNLYICVSPKEGQATLEYVKFKVADEDYKEASLSKDNSD